MTRGLHVRRAERGLSLIETMVGLALGLGVVGAALTATAAQARWHHAAATEARLLQDLHAASELIHRQLRRAGQQAPATTTAPPGAGNPYTGITIGAGGRQIEIAASRDGVDDGAVGPDETVGMRLDGNVLELRVGQGAWQAVTDAALVRVTGVRFDLHATPPTCGRPRAVRHVSWWLEAESVGVAGVRRRVDGLTRVRHDAALPAACPAGT
jgi:prepilin peptidase dependent protein B